MIFRMRFAITNCLLCALVAQGQIQAGPPFDVDDPATSEPGCWDLYVSYLSWQTDTAKGKSLPHISLCYAINDRMDVSLTTQHLSASEDGVGSVSGMGDISLSVRRRFQNEGKGRPSLAWGYEINLPTASASDGLGTGRVDHTGWLTWGKSVGRSYLFGDAGFTASADPATRDNWYYGLGYTYQLTQTIVAGGQLVCSTPTADGDTHELGWGVGGTWSFAPDKALLLQLGCSERGFSDLNVYAGLSFHFK
ncbi:MAG: transporter [Armatimonadota bacterium]